MVLKGTVPVFCEMLHKEGAKILYHVEDDVDGTMELQSVVATK
jgi:hypothetical protein